MSTEGSGGECWTQVTLQPQRVANGAMQLLLPHSADRKLRISRVSGFASSHWRRQG